MPVLDLDAYTSLQSNLFVKVTLPSSSLLFSDRLDTVTINSDSYPGLGKLLSVSNSSSEIRATGYEVVVAVSGIPNTAISEIVNANIKGNAITIVRALFNATNGTLLAVTGNPVNRFAGFVNNIVFEEEYDIDSRTSTNRLLLQCSSKVDILSNKIAGRKTNPASQKRFYPTDISMDRVPKIESSYFDFGANK